MDRLFAALRSRGPAWDDSKPLEGQLDWAGHAAFMDALFEERFALLVGPLEGTRDALLILRTSSPSEIQPTVAALKDINPELIVPAHCTGWKATHALARELPQAFVPNSVGTRFIL